MMLRNLENDLSHDQKKALVFLICFIGVLLNISCFTGLISSDDLHYYRFVKKLVEGNYGLEYHHFSVRYGLLIPVAISYKILNISELSTVLVPFISSVLSVPLIVIIGWKLFGYTSGIIAGVLFVTFPVQLHYASILVPETIANFYVLVAITFYISEYDGFNFLLSVLSGIFISIAYLTKEPTILIIIALIADTILKKSGIDYWECYSGVDQLLFLNLSTIIWLQVICFLGRMRW